MLLILLILLIHYSLSLPLLVYTIYLDKAKLKASAIQHYGSIDKYTKVLKQQPLPPAGIGKLRLKLDGIFKQIASLWEKDVSDPEVQKLVGNWM